MLNKVEDIEALTIEHEPDIMLITETWLHKDILDSEITPKSYVIVRKDRNGRGGGVALLIRDNIEFTVLSVPYDIEAVCIRAVFKNRVVHICGIYRPPSSPVQVLSSLRCFMDRNVQYGDNIILLGDFNLPGINWNDYSPGVSEISNCEQLLELVFCFGLSQVVSDYTRVCPRTSSILDLVFVSNQLLPFLLACETSDGISDHKLVVLSLSLLPTVVNHSPKYVLNFARADDVGVLDLLEGSFERFCEYCKHNQNPDYLWGYYSNLVMSSIKLFIPKRLKKTSNRSPWITREIIHLKRQLKRKRKNYKSNPSAQNQ